MNVLDNFFQNVEKRTSALVVCFLNNSYGFFTSLQAFLNLSIMQKQQKGNKIIHKIILSPISKSSKKKKISKILRDFLFDLGRIAHSRIIFAPVITSLRNGKNTFTCLEKVLRNYALCWDLTFRKKKWFWDPILMDKQVATTLFYLANEGKMWIGKFFCMGTSTISKVLTRISFYFRKFFHCIYLTKEHNYFANRKSYRTTLFT